MQHLFHYLKNIASLSSCIQCFPWEGCEFDSCSFLLLLEVFRLLFDFDVLKSQHNEAGCVFSPLVTLFSIREPIQPEMFTFLSFPKMYQCYFFNYFILPPTAPPLFGASYYPDSYTSILYVIQLLLKYLSLIFLLPSGRFSQSHLPAHPFFLNLQPAFIFPNCYLLYVN